MPSGRTTLNVLWIAKVPPEIHSPRIWEVARRLVRRGHRVTIVTARTRRDLPSVRAIDGIEVHYVWTCPGPLRRGRLGFYLTRLPFYVTGPLAARRLSRRHPPDVVIEDAAPAGCITSPWLIRQLERPWVLDTHHLFGPFRAWWTVYGPVALWGALWERWLRHGRIRPTVLLSDSRPLLDEFAAVIPGMKTALVPNGVDLERFGRVRDPGRINEASIQVIAVGRPTPAKGHRFLVDAAGLLRDRLDVRVTIYGEGPLRAQLARQASRLGIADRVLLPGHVDHAAIHRAFAAADLFVMPSLAEGLPVALVEALGSGVPVIASDIPEHRAVGPAGVIALVPPGDAKALADAIAGLAADSPARARLSRRGRELAEQRYTWDKVTDAFEALLVELTAQ